MILVCIFFCNVAIIFGGDINSTESAPNSTLTTNTENTNFTVTSTVTNNQALKENATEVTTVSSATYSDYLSANDYDYDYEATNTTGDVSANDSIPSAFLKLKAFFEIFDFQGKLLLGPIRSRLHRAKAFAFFCIYLNVESVCIHQ